MKYIIVTLLSFFFTQPVLAATGDILYQNCTDSNPCNGGTLVDPTRPSSPAWVRSVETSGCQSGSCLKLDAFENILEPGSYGAGNTSIGTTSVNGHDEITVSYMVKFDESSNSISQGLIKGIRPYNGGNNYFLSNQDVHNSVSPRSYYVSSFDELLLVAEDVVDSVKVDPLYCTEISTDYYSCDPRAKIAFTVDGMANFGTTWRTVTQYFKMPSSSMTVDGEWELWIDTTLVASGLWDRHDDGNDTMSNLTFYPSSEANEEFEHWMDEMIVYEGYVPPVEDPGPVRSNKSPSTTLSAGTTSVNITLDTDS